MKFYLHFHAYSLNPLPRLWEMAIHHPLPRSVVGEGLEFSHIAQHKTHLGVRRGNHKPVERASLPTIWTRARGKWQAGTRALLPERLDTGWEVCFTLSHIQL